MGNLQCICNPLIVYLRDSLGSDPHTEAPKSARGLVGPRGRRISLDGVYLSFHALQLFGPDLLEVGFEVRLDGRPRLVKRCLLISNLPREATEEDVRSVFAAATRCIMRIERDVGYLYLGTVIVTIGGVNYDLGDYLGLQASVRWQPPSPVVLPPPAPSPQPISVAAPMAPTDPELVAEEKGPAPAPVVEPLVPAPRDPEFVVPAPPAPPPSPAGDSEHIISKSIEHHEIIEDMFASRN